jgi:hypothetical protein
VMERALEAARTPVEDREQRGLACPIRADETDTVAIVD